MLLFKALKYLCKNLIWFACCSVCTSCSTHTFASATWNLRRTNQFVCVHVAYAIRSLHTHTHIVCMAKIASFSGVSHAECNAINKYKSTGSCHNFEHMFDSFESFARSPVPLHLRVERLHPSFNFVRLHFPHINHNPYKYSCSGICNKSPNLWVNYTAEAGEKFTANRKWNIVLYIIVWWPWVRVCQTRAHKLRVSVSDLGECWRSAVGIWASSSNNDSSQHLQADRATMARITTMP